MPTPKVNSWLGWRIFTVNRGTLSLVSRVRSLVLEGRSQDTDTHKDTHNQSVPPSRRSPSFIPVAAPTRCRWDLLRFDPKSTPNATPNQQPINSMHPSSTGILQIWCRFSSFAIPWDPGVSFFYLRRLLQQHLTTAGVCCPCKLASPIFNRRFVRSVHPGVRISNAPATLYRRNCLLQRRCPCFFLLWLKKDFVVIWFSFEDLFVIWLLF
jgi:hypothetical protein